MKKTLIYLLCAAVMGLAPSHAKEPVAASSVHVSLSQGKAAASLVAVPVYPPGDMQKGIFKDVKNVAPYKADDKPAWHVVNIPIVLTARGKTKSGEKEPANYIGELTVTAYLLFRAPEDKSSDSSSKADKEAKKYSVVEKTITYQNILLDVKGGKREEGQPVGYAEMCVGLFFPRMEAYKIVGSDNAADEIVKPGRFVGYAVEAKFKGARCPEAKVEKSSATGQGTTLTSKLFDTKLKRELGSASWWKGKTSEHFRSTDVKAFCISETPMAPFYAAFYPATKPIYGEPQESSTDSTADPTLAPVMPAGDSSDSSSSSRSTSSSGTSSRI